MINLKTHGHLALQLPSSLPWLLTLAMSWQFPSLLVVVLPLLVMAIGLYAFAGFTVLSRMRTEVLVRERNTQWVKDMISGSVRS